MVRLRLTRMGRKKRPYYRIVAVDKRKRRDGAFIERLGYYHPLGDPTVVQIDGEKVLKWLRVGAQPSNTVLSLLRKEGIWYRFRLEKRNLPENQIDEMMAEWFASHSEERIAAEPAPEVKAEVTEALAATAPVEEKVEEAKVAEVEPEPEKAEEESTPESEKKSSEEGNPIAE